MKKILAILLLCNTASADWQEKIFVYQCNPQENYLSAWFFDGQNGPPKIPFSLDGKKTYDPADLIEQDLEVDIEARGGSLDDYIKGKSEDESCTLSGHEYYVVFTGAPNNPNVQRRCGAVVTLNIRVERDGMQVFSGDFEPDCHAMYTPIRQIKVIESEPVTIQITYDEVQSSE